MKHMEMKINQKSSFDIEISNNLNKFSPELKDNLKMSNDFFDHLTEIIETRLYKDNIRNLSIGIIAPEYYIFTYSFKKLKGFSRLTHIIIRIMEDNNGILNMVGLGENIVDTDPIKFGDKVIKKIDDAIEYDLKTKYSISIRIWQFFYKLKNRKSLKIHNI